MPIEDVVDKMTPETATAEPGEETGVVEPTPAAEQPAPEVAATEPAPVDAKADTPADPPKKSLQDVVRDALKPVEDEAKPNPDARPKPEEAKAEADAPKVEAADDDAEIAAFKDHPRWKQVTQERDQFKAEIETLKGPAEQYAHIQQFMDQHNVPAQEVAEAMTIVAMMKNPATIQQAVSKLQGLVDQGRAYMGEGIDADLQERVDAGEVSETFAKEMTKQRAVANATRAAAEAATKRAEAATTAATESTEQASRKQTADRATEFLTVKQKTDPDYAKKAPFLKAAILDKRMAHQGQLTPEAGEKIVAEAYAEVTKNLLAAGPSLKPTPKTPSSNSPGSGSTPANPKSLSEAIALGLNSGAAA